MQRLLRLQIARDVERVRELERELARVRARIERAWARLLDAELKV